MAVPLITISTPLLLGKRILLAEDNEVAQQQFLIMLRRMGGDVETATNGLQVVEMLERESFDLLVLDIQMPPIHGIELVRNFRSQSGFDMKILGLSSMDFKGRALGAGMDVVLIRPVETHSFLSALGQLFSEERVQRSGEIQTAKG
jgi:CheY-like chemotaxis protein